MCGIPRLLGDDSGRREEVEHQLAQVRVKLVKARSNVVVPRAEAVKAAVDNATIESTQLVAVKALASVWWDLDQARSKVGVLWVHSGNQHQLL
jgi:hypothetical protein